MKERVPAAEGWFTMDEAAPQLVGARGKESGSFFWPTTLAVSANPVAPGEAREPALLSRRGRLWSWTTNHYAPPEPYVAPDPFVPYTVCAVELDAEQMIVLGQLATGADPTLLELGMAMELVLGSLYADDEHEYVVWQWAPPGDDSAATGGERSAESTHEQGDDSAATAGERSAESTHGRGATR